MASNWNSSLSDEATAQILSLASALDAMHEDGSPNFRKIQKLGGPALLREAVVSSTREITDKGRDDDWLFSAIIDPVTIENAGGLGEEATAYLTRILFGAYNPMNPSGVGQVFAKEHGYVLCEYRQKGEKTLRFFSANKDVVLKLYMEDAGEQLRKAFVSARKRTRVALDVVPEIEGAVSKALTNKVRAGLLELPEAQADVKSTRTRNGNGYSVHDEQLVNEEV